MAQLSGTYNPTDEWLKTHLRGWLEKRDSGKPVATLRAHYRTVPLPEEKQILAHDLYAQTFERHFAKKAEEAVFYKAIYKDLFRSELALLTQSLPTSGTLLEIMIHFPAHQSELMFLAKTAQIETENELGRNIYHAHLKVLSVNQRSIVKMMHAITHPSK